MIYNIWHNDELMGSVHHSYEEEPHKKENISVRLKSFRSLETLLQLSPQSRLRIEKNHGSSEVRYGTFKNEILTKARDIHIEGNPKD